MNDYHRLTFRTRPPGLLARVGTALVAGAVLVASFFLGLMVLAVFAGLALILAVFLAVRIWFARREIERRVSAARAQRRPGQGHVIEGEFVEIRRRSGDERGSPGS